MALLLKEADVQKLLTMDMALDAVEGAFCQRRLGKASVRPRSRMPVDGGSQSLMAGWVGGGVNAYGIKVGGGPRASGSVRPRLGSRYGRRISNNRQRKAFLGAATLTITEAADGKVMAENVIKASRQGCTKFRTYTSIPTR